VGSGPEGIAVTPDGKTAYVTNHASNSVTPIATATNTAGTAIPVGSNPRAIAVSPDEAPVASFSTSGTTSGSPVSFDASASTVAYGSIASYAWNFGDGTTITTTGPTTTHTYAKPGAYAITLTETDSAGTSTTQVFTGQTMSRNGGPSALATRTLAIATVAYAINSGSNSVTPIATATNKAGSPISVGTDPFAVALTPDGKTAYVVNRGSDSVTPIATATNTAGTDIPVGADPKAIAVTPDGKTAYVVNRGSDSVTPIATATNTAGTDIPVGADPKAIAVTPDGKTAYVANTVDGTVTPIATATNTPGTAITVGKQPFALAITPDGKTAYAANIGAGTVTPIATATNTPGTAITVGSGPEAVAVTPDGKTVYVANAGANSVTPITTATNTPGTAVTVGSGPVGIAVTPDGRTAYVANFTSGTVTPIATATNASGSPITVGTNPFGVAVTPDGTTAYVANSGSSSVTPIATATNAAGTAITVGNTPEGIAVTPDQAPAARFTTSGTTVGSPVSFTASASTVAYGTIVSYAWNFGDGTSVTTTTGPTTSHTYTNPGSYTVTVTETDSAGTSTTKVFTGQTMSRNGGPAATASKAVNVTLPTKEPYNPLAPARITDTRPSSGFPNAGKTLGPGQSLDVQVSGAGGVPSSGVTAVVLNVTVTNTTTSSFLTAWPTGAARPTASNLNWVAGQTVANLSEVGLGAGGKVSVFNPAGSVDVVVDVEGYAAPAATAGTGLYNPLAPARITDTRPSSGFPNAGKTLGPGQSLDVQVTGAGGVPKSGVGAVVVNVTATNTTKSSFLTVWPTGVTRPTASNLNWFAGQTVPNRVQVPVSPEGKVSIFNPAGSVDVVVDVGGYFTDSSNLFATGAQFAPNTPARITDTRSGSGFPNAGKTLGTGGLLKVQVSGAGGVPATGVTAAVLNVTATNTTTSSFLTVWPTGATRPTASDLNWVATQTVPNLVVVKLGSDGSVQVFNAAGSTDVVVDVSGWYS
jgi:YVTN family beta-propeller protein